MRTGYQQLLQPCQVMQLLQLRAHPAEIGQGLVRTTAAFDTFVTRVAEDDRAVGRQPLLVDHDTLPVYGVHARGEIVRNVDVVGDAEETERAICDTNGLETNCIVADDATGCTDDVSSKGMSGMIEVRI